jgi:hypothetical protein
MGTQPGAASSQTTAAAPAGQAAAPQVDADAARQALTAARDTLSQLTQLPAAAQLTGDARTQVGELIANFNELITTKGEWRPSYDKLAANLNSLLGPDAGAGAAVSTMGGTTTASNPPAGEGANASTAGTPGAVGTSGTASAQLDPAIRAKLVELRSHLSEFEKASGGAAK